MLLTENSSRRMKIVPLRIKMEAAERSIENKYSVLRAVRRGDVGQKPKSVRRGFRHSDFQILIIGEKR